jgi:hypothetical protein
MIELVLENVVVNQEDPVNYQDEIPRGEVTYDFLNLKKRWFLVKKITCWKLAVELTLLKILSFATSHYAIGMQLVVICNYFGHVCNYKFVIV